MPIKTATNYLASSNDDSREQTIKTNFRSLRATSTRTLNNYKHVVRGNGIATVAAAFPGYEKHKSYQEDAFLSLGDLKWGF